MTSKLAVITGGSTGIGLAAAQCLANNGYKVIITGRNAHTLSEAVALIGPHAIGVNADAADLNDLPKLSNAVASAGGKLHFLFVNAGIAQFSPIAETSPEFYDTLFNVNVRGAFFTAQAMIPHMVDAGSIAFNASIAKDAAFPGSTVYAATKAAVAAIAKTLAAELAARNIRVNTISPGPTATPIFGKMGLSEQQVSDFATRMQGLIPLKRLAQAEDVGDLVLFLASDASKFITGTDIAVDGGFLLGKMAA